MIPSCFNIRVYGVLIQAGKVLVTDEVRSGIRMTKFPGGGLEFGEGIKECLIREFKEELNVTVEVQNLFYINDFYQVSSFNEQQQLVSIYYKVVLKKGEIKTTEIPFLFETNEPQCFRWLKLNELSRDDVTFPIDKIVIEKLIN
ncbi:MAG: NUDIX hydrolase [Flavobacteriales bacterium]|nr:NUDIX hydrolase [Flavobacteriales bacterium]MBO73057.1 NUDIX hydrolase [Flavobacteriales bacterium]|tara:strand:- start:142 stop:573 length:432 start_codon:yes stop_codon:yes gene_type:complete